MKNRYPTLLLLAFIFVWCNAEAQIVEIESSDQGLSVPRVVDTSSITSPSAGMIIYQSADLAGIYSYNGSFRSKLHSINLTPGDGIEIIGTTINNIAPDQDVSITDGGATTVSGSYPNFIDRQCG